MSELDVGAGFAEWAKEVSLVKPIVNDRFVISSQSLY
jgi:hypothetical protein